MILETLNVISKLSYDLSLFNVVKWIFNELFSSILNINEQEGQVLKNELFCLVLIITTKSLIFVRKDIRYRHNGRMHSVLSI